MPLPSSSLFTITEGQRNSKRKQKKCRPVKGALGRDKSLHLRISQAELDLLDDCAKVLGVNRMDAIITALQNELGNKTAKV